MCRGTLPSQVTLPNIQVLQATQQPLQFKPGRDQLNSRGENLPEYLTFDRCSLAGSISLGEAHHHTQSRLPRLASIGACLSGKNTMQETACLLLIASC